MSKQIIYHGSYCKVEKPKIIEGKYTKDFTVMTEEWLDFIINCRNGKKHNYDIVVYIMKIQNIYISVLYSRENFNLEIVIQKLKF